MKVRRSLLRLLLVSCLSVLIALGPITFSNGETKPTAATGRESEPHGQMQSDAVVEQQRDLRRQLHLRSDEVHVRTQLNRSDSREQREDPETYGLVLEGDERQEILARNRVMDDAQRIAAWGENNPDAFGGVHVDHELGGKLVVSLVGAFATSAAAEVNRHVELRNRVIIRSVSHRYTDLVAIASEIIGASTLDYPPSVTRSSVAVERNGIDIYVSHPEHVADAEQRWGRVPNPRFLVSPPDQAIDHDNNHPGGVEDPVRSWRWNPMMGGLTLGSNPDFSGHCTSNMIAYDLRPQGTRYFALTAGHCFDLHENVYQGDWLLGRVDNRTIGGSLDVAFIDVTTPTGTTRGLSSYVYERPNYQNQHFLDHHLNPAVGQMACLSGRYNPGDANWLNCGTITEGCGNQTYWVGNETVTLTCVARANVWVRRGDSGSPVYRNRGLLGLAVSAPVLGSESAQSVTFSRSDRILSQVNLDGYFFYASQPPPSATPPPPPPCTNLVCEILGIVFGVIDSVLGLLP